jgi:hypothetical protein
MSRLDGTRSKGRDVLANAVPGLEHTVAGTVQVHERGEGAEPRIPDVFTPTSGPEENHLMHETKCIVTNDSRDTKQ